MNYDNEEYGYGLHSLFRVVDSAPRPHNTQLAGSRYQHSISGKATRYQPYNWIGKTTKGKSKLLPPQIVVGEANNVAYSPSDPRLNLQASASTSGNAHSYGLNSDLETNTSGLNQLLLDIEHEVSGIKTEEQYELGYPVNALHSYHESSTSHSDSVFSPESKGAETDRDGHSRKGNE